MILTTERLLLREFVAEDWPAILAYQSDPRYLRYYEWTGRTPEEVQQFLQMFVAQQAEQPRRKFQLAVVLRSDGRLIGNCGIRLKTADAREGDIGYEFAPDEWGKGYATEAAHAIVGFGFGELGLHRIWSWCIAENAGSWHVMEKLGMRREGQLRENEWFKGRWWDTFVYGILEHEWKMREQ